MNPIIKVKRSGALGDVILTTPVIRRLKEYYPSGSIYVDTGYPNIFDGNPFVAGVNHWPSGIDKYYDLDLCYERQPKMHVIDAYLTHVFGDVDMRDKQQQLAYGDFRHVLCDGLDWSRTIVIHPAVSWANRTLPPSFYNDLIRCLTIHNITCVVVGSGFDHLLGNTVDLRGKLRHVSELTSLMAKARCVVTPDSGLLHVAGATSTPIVAMFTVARSEYRMPFRNGVLGGGVTPFTPDIDCYGCLGDAPAPVTSLGCRRSDLKCLTLFDPQAVANAVLTNILAKE